VKKNRRREVREIKWVRKGSKRKRKGKDKTCKGERKGANSKTKRIGS